MTKISKGVPFPGRTKAPGRPTKYPWREMAVGDSFPVHIHDVGTVRVSAKRYGDRHGLEFAVAKIAETGEYRCWRLA